MKASGPKRRLVLVGGGHAHVQVLRSLVMRPQPDVEVTLIVDDPVAVYSGMVPGLVAGQYSPHDVAIDLVPLARRAGAAVVLEPADRVDAHRREVCFSSERPAVPFEVCSLNIGSTVAHTELPGVRPLAVPTRPIQDLNQRLDAHLQACQKDVVDVVVVGAGAAGVELAFAVEARLSGEDRAHRVTLVSARAPRVGGGIRGLRRVRNALSERNIQLREGNAVVAVHPDSVDLEDGACLPADLVLWSTGAAAHSLGRRSGLPTDAQGFVQTMSTLEVVDHPGIFASGDCAVLADGPAVPRAGVYAVRAGPILVHNLLVARERQQHIPYRPQKTYLALLNTCDGGAIGTKGSWVWEGRWLGRLKHWIDSQFVQKFQVLDASGVPSPRFERGMPPMDPELEMECGGCAAKLADEPLRAALAALPPPPGDPDVVAGVDAADDVAILRHGDGLLLQTVDAFPTFTSDPWLVGRVAAINALNDVYAKGATPRFALAIVEVPRAHGATVLGQALAGLRYELDRSAVSLVGGHTTIGEQLKVGLSVTGSPPTDGVIWPTRGAVPGDVLLLTRPLGSGVLLHADMAGRARGPWVQAVHRHLTRSNQPAIHGLRGHPIHAATDVTGFGLARHLKTMLQDDRCEGVLRLSSLPLLPGVATLLRAGERSSFHEQNRMDETMWAVAPDLRRDPLTEVVFDPQTAGGLLLAIPPESAETALQKIRCAGFESAALVGVVGQRRGGPSVRMEP